MTAVHRAIIVAVLLAIIAAACTKFVFVLQENGELKANLKQNQKDLVKAALSANQAAAEASKDILARDVALESAIRSADFNLKLAANMEKQLREIAQSDENLDRCLGIRLPDSISLP